MPDLKSPDARLRRGANHERFAATPAAAPRHDAQRAAFNKYDTNQSGELDHKELRSALETVGLTITSAHAATLLAKYDKDQSGLMEFDEFQQLCTALEAVMLDLAGDSSGKPPLETTPMKVPSVMETGTAGESTLPQIRTRGLVIVPVGVRAGEHFIAQTADGQRLRVVAPPGSSAGMTIPIDPVSGDVVVDNVHEGFRGGGGGGGGNRFGAGVTGGAAAAVAAVRGAAAAEPMRWWAVGGKEAAVSGVTRAEVAIRTSASNTGGAYGGGAPGGGGAIIIRRVSDPTAGTWTPTAFVSLVNPGPAGAEFGAAVSTIEGMCEAEGIDKDVPVIGAPGWNGNRGSIAVYPCVADAGGNLIALVAAPGGDRRHAGTATIRGAEESTTTSGGASQNGRCGCEVRHGGKLLFLP